MLLWFLKKGCWKLKRGQLSKNRIKVNICFSGALFVCLFVQIPLTSLEYHLVQMLVYKHACLWPLGCDTAPALEPPSSRHVMLSGSKEEIALHREQSLRLDQTQPPLEEKEVKASTKRTQKQKKHKKPTPTANQQPNKHPKSPATVSQRTETLKIPEVFSEHLEHLFGSQAPYSFYMYSLL